MKRIEETSFILSGAVKEVREMLPSRITAIYLSNNRVLNVKTENFNLKVNCENQNPLLYLSENLFEKTKHNFNDALSAYAKGMRITDIEQIGNDRIVKLTLTKELFIVIELIPNRFNILLVENDVIKNLYSYKKNKDGELILKPGVKYSPKTREKGFMESLSAKERESAEEMHFQEEDIKNVKEYFLLTDDKRFYILFCENKNLQTLDSSKSPSHLIEKAFAFSIQEARDKNEASKSHSIENKISNLKKKIDALKDEDSLSAEAEDLREMAETLKANIYRADKEKEFASVFNEKKILKFNIPKGVSLSEYLKILFEEYKKTKNLSSQNAEIKKTLQKEIIKLEERLTTESEEERKKEIRDEETIGRVFTTPNGFKVLSGRSAQENDELTVRIAKKDDIFFHAREAKGSHVILRTAGGTPLKEDILFAASIAAYYSAGKHSKLVSVSYIEKRFVVKRRNSPKGEVVMLKEKTLFVKPLSGRESK